jgi:hypothetical protein
MPASLVRRRLLLGLVLAWLLGCAGAARAQGIELAQLQTVQRDGALSLEFAVRIALPRAVEDALQRGVPVYFVAEADLMRSRWYWRDERVARVQRSWRVAYQPLTNVWRVALGALNQNYASLDDALASVSRTAGWRIAETDKLDPDSRYYVRFDYRLDTAQLPLPMQIGLGGPSEWAIGVERTLKVGRDP